ncbi:MAG: metallophosphoesterase [Candidatus Marinimicrobia bacterium]|nr:metallophosphoesterase [Candidatus Neomarinimicrobiota bacterium]MCF7921858.1 metallophosphoesterase [Candidatus Neomarinimicrobiota bacterium]
MKSKFIFAFILILSMAISGISQTIHQIAAGESTISDTYDDAAAGDIIELITSGGDYEEENDLVIDAGKPITVRAAAGLAEKPRWSATGGWALVLPADGLTLDGIILDGSISGGTREVIIRCAEPEWYELTIGFDMTLLNCDFVNTNHAIYGEDQNQLGTVTISNCTFVNMARSAIQFSTGGTAPGAVNQFICENSSFWNISGYAIYVQATSIDANPAIDFQVDHVTIHDATNGNIYPRDINGAVIKNSIMTSSASSPDPACIIFGTSSQVSNILYNNFAAVGLQQGALVSQLSNVQAGMDPLYASAAGGNFTLLPGSPALSAGDDGSHLGDPRWWPENNTEYIFVSAGTDGISTALSNAVDGQSILLTTDGGTYEESATLTVTHDVSLKVASGLTSRPTIVSAATGAMFEISSNFTLDGVILDGSLGGAATTTAITNSPGTSGYNLTVTNTDFLNFENAEQTSGFGIYGDVTSVIDSVLVEDCYFAHILDMGISFNDPVTPTGSVNYFMVENCTFWDMSSEAIYVDGADSDVTTPDPEFFVNKVTVYDCGSYNIIPHYVDGAVISNSIVVLPVMNTDYAPAKIYGTNSRIENFLYFNTRDIDLSSGATDFQLINVVAQADPLMIDPENGDFSYPVNSPAVLFDNLGVIRLGAETWWPWISFPYAIRWGTYHNTLRGLTITWSNRSENDSLRWGYTTEFEMGAFPGVRRNNYSYGEGPLYLFDYTFPVLDPLTDIYYSLKYSGLWGETKSYSTSVDTASSQFSFITGGDQQTGTIPWQAISTMASDENADFYLMPGDIVDNTLYSGLWEEQYYAYGEEFLENSLTFYTPSNHTYYDTDSGIAFLNQFVQPGLEKWFYFEQGNTLVINLNSEGQLSTQMSFMENILATTDATWIIVYFHRPFFTTGGHAGEMDAAIPHWWRLFDEYGVDIILNGHEHTYTRSKPINLQVSESEPVEMYGSAEGQGRLQMQTGTMGGPIYNNSPNGWWLEYTESLWNYVKFQVDDDELYLECINSDGEVVDSLRMSANGTYQTDIDDSISQLPTVVELYQNYPNPFNPTTTIRYTLPEVSDVSLTIYDIRGSEVKSWQLDHQTPGMYNLQWDGLNSAGLEVSTGMYFAKLNCGDFSQVIKMVYLQ